MKYILENIDSNVDLIEQLGTKEKFWFTHKDGDSWLFKYSRANTGEHWSEKCAAEICSLLHIPHATYELATVQNRFGVITKNLVPENGRMVMGNEVLHSLHGATQEYPAPISSPDAKIVRVREHTVARVLGCLDHPDIHVPISAFELADLNAADVFCGYLMLDALISNQDRHHENWAIILNNDTGHKYLCPTYDHAACLGRELLDTERKERLESKDIGRKIPNFVKRAKSELFRLKTDKHPLATVDAFFHAVEKREKAKTHWLTKLSLLSENDITIIFEKIPEDCITDYSKDFAIQMILENKRRLLENEQH